ncbi:MAG: GTP-binding protein [Promethearchaeota archaeon]
MLISKKEYVVTLDKKQIHNIIHVYSKIKRWNIIKIVVTGPVQCGKSSYIRYFDEKSMNIETQGQNNKHYTVGLDLASIEVNGFDVYLFGTPGLIRMQVMREVLMGGADGIIFLIDSINPDSDTDALKILASLQKYLKPNLPLIFCANKQNEETSRSIEDLISIYNLQKDTKFFKINTNTGLNVMESLRHIVQAIYAQYKDVLQVIHKHQDNLNELAKELNLNLSELNNFLYNLEVKRFLEIDRVKKKVRLKPSIPL